MSQTIWTVGHSTHAIEDFLALLEAHRIGTLVDVRHYPASRRYPQFNRDAIAEALAGRAIRYEHILALGGRRATHKCSRNTNWRNPSFRGYADHMEGREFLAGAERLLAIAAGTKTAYMCSEAVWWQCHRSMISDYLKSVDIEVNHIVSPTATKPHPYTQPARIVNGRLTYVPEFEQPTLF